MKPEEFAGAQQAWQKHGLADYDLDLDASLGLAGRLHIEVRGGQPTAMTLGGQPTRRHLWEYWTVPGLLEIIRLDCERNESAKHDPAGGGGQPLFQQAVFDQETGLPRDYRRTDQTSGQSGGWRITQFHSVSRGPADASGAHAASGDNSPK